MKHLDLAHEQPVPESATQPKKKIRNLTQIFTPEVLEQFAGLATDAEEPIFVFGMPRSGSTLTEQILSRHSQVGAGGELFFWRDHIRRIVNLKDLKFNPNELTRAGRRYIEQLHSKAPGKAFVTDKFPSNYAFAGMLHLIFPKAKFVHTRRHPIDTCLSIYMRPFATNSGIGRSKRETVDTYLAYLEVMRGWKEILGPDRFIDVDYEALVQDPETQTRRLIELCGLDWEEACLHPEEGDRRVVTFSKWQVRQPVYTTSVERWRRYEPWLGEFRELLSAE